MQRILRPNSACGETVRTYAVALAVTLANEVTAGVTVMVVVVPIRLLQKSVAREAKGKDAETAASYRLTADEIVGRDGALH